jgi:hypothetical protein
MTAIASLTEMFWGEQSPLITLSRQKMQTFFFCTLSYTAFQPSNLCALKRGT